MKAKRRENEIKKPILILGIAFIVLGCSLGVTSLAWFMNPTSRKTVEGIEGQATGNYFDGGDGSKESPYGISTAKQLYYFNWLQDLGYFNKDANNDGTIDKQYYFVLKKDIDASDYTLPPAGTTKYPFLGHFNGAGYKISNLTISNTKGDEKSGLSKNGWPSDADDKVAGNISVVGFFGIVGENDIISGDSLTNLIYTADVNEVEDLYFDNLTVETSTDSTLIGLIAGYANGKLTNCGVHKGKFNFQNSSVGVITNTTDGNPLKGNDKLSKYSLIGAYNSTNFTWDGQPESSQSGTSWGGSIDFESLSKRVTYISQNTTVSNHVYNSTAFNAKLYSTNSYDYSTAKLQSANFMDGTYLPLNIDTSTMLASNGAAYKTAKEEKVLSSNTGYIVGEGTDGSRSYLRMMHNYTSGSRDASHLADNSIYTVNQKDSGATRSDSIASSNFSFMWLKNDGTTYRIRDDDNSEKSFSEVSGIGGGNYSGTLYYGSEKDSSGNEQGLNLSKYKEVKANFINAVADATTENFYSTNKALSLHYLQLKSGTSPTAKTFSNVTLNGTTYDSYTLFTGGINFTLSKEGNLTMLSGISYQGSGAKGNLPDIYEVVDNSGTKSLKKIYKIYKDSNGKTAYKYDSSALASNETLIFDLNEMSTEGLMEIGAIYYFEFPMLKGNYFMTRVDDGSVYVPYIYYLDIGAGASGSGPDEAETTIPPIDFVYYSDTANKTIKPIDSTIEKTDDEGKTTTIPDYTPSKVTFAISGKPTSVYFYRSWAKNEDNENIIVVYYCNLAGETLAPIEVTGTGTRDEGTESGYETSN